MSASKLTVGTHWYICPNHISSSMKGITIVENTTGVKDIQAFSNIVIYPNPSNGKIQLAAEGSILSNNYTITIFDIQGKNVYSAPNAERPALNEIDLSYLPKGIYYVRIFDGIITHNKKIIIN